jgi:hypothetical protein
MRSVLVSQLRVRIFRILQSSFLPLLLVVFSVTQDASDVNHSPFVFDSSNQPASIMAYIENNIPALRNNSLQL